MTEKENHLPNLSSEERAHALELAIQARRRYAALKARVKSGELTFTDAMDEEDAKRIHFYYGDEPKPVDSFFKPKRRRKVRCTETGVVYESIKDARERTKISPNGIGSAASGMAGGYHWEYADD